MKGKNPLYLAMSTQSHSRGYGENELVSCQENYFSEWLEFICAIDLSTSFLFIFPSFCLACLFKQDLNLQVVIPSRSQMTPIGLIVCGVRPV